MAGNTLPGGLGARLRDFARGFLGGAGEVAEGTAAGASTLEAAAQSVGASLERWRSTGSVLRALTSGGLDRLTAVGGEVELVTSLDALTRLRATSARIRLGEVVVGEVAVGGGPLRVWATATEEGVFPVLVDALDRAGAVVAWGNAADPPICQVIDQTPTATVDAEMLLAEPSLDLTPLRELALHGWSLCYVDLHPVDRRPAIRAALLRHGLPLGAVLVHPQTEVEFKTLGIDFHRLFVTTRIRRLRADGVPLVVMISEAPRSWASAAEEGVFEVDLAGLAARLRGEGGLEGWRAAAADFCQERGQRGQLGWRLDHLSGARRVEGNTCVIELDNRRARERIFAAIDGAQRSVHLQFYILRPGLFSERLAVRLIQRARAGVAVRICVDALFSTQDVLGLRNQVVEGLSQEPGIEIVAAAPISADEPLELRRFKRRDHRKLVVIDDRLAFVGGRNGGDEYYTGFDEVPISDWTPHERVPWLDAHVEVEGPLVAAVQGSFVETWHAAGGRAIPAVKEELAPSGAPSGAPTGGSKARLVVHKGLEDANTLGAYEAIIESARARIFILNDFPILDTLQRSLLRALQRGVAVVILTGSAVARRGDGTMLRGPMHREIFEYMTKHRLEPLLRAGVVVYEFATPPLPEVVARGGVVRPYVHAKVMCADGRVASVGSANLDVTASYWEHEANVVIEDPAVVGRLEATIEGLCAGSLRLDVESAYWRREARQREIASALWPETLYV
jgi:phosphatidylserine/phosphatidylglycerophosphate/cardiolipin synthase-like enzyme